VVRAAAVKSSATRKKKAPRRSRGPSVVSP